MNSIFLAFTLSLVAYKLCFLFYIYINKECQNIKVFTSTYFYILLVLLVTSHPLTLHHITTQALILHQYNIHHQHTQNFNPNSLHNYDHITHTYKHLKTCPLANFISMRNLTYYTIYNDYSFVLTIYPIWIHYTLYTLPLPIVTPQLPTQNIPLTTKESHTYKQYTPPYILTTTNNHFHKQHHHNTHNNPSIKLRHKNLPITIPITLHQLNNFDNHTLKSHQTNYLTFYPKKQYNTHTPHKITPHFKPTSAYRPRHKMHNTYRPTNLKEPIGYHPHIEYYKWNFCDTPHLITTSPQNHLSPYTLDVTLQTHLITLKPISILRPLYFPPTTQHNTTHPTKNTHTSLR